MPGNADRPSAQPDKQRKAQAQAPQHRRREMMSAHLSEDLLVKYERRSIPIRTGDQVEIMRGDFSGQTGEVLEIDYDAQEIEVDGVVNRSSDGSQVPRPIHPSNVRLVELDLTDPQRRAALERKGVTVEEPEPEPEPEPEAEETDEEEQAPEPDEDAGPDEEPPEEGPEDDAATGEPGDGPEDELGDEPEPAAKGPDPSDVDEPDEGEDADESSEVDREPEPTGDEGQPPAEQDADLAEEVEGRADDETTTEKEGSA